MTASNVRTSAAPDAAERELVIVRVFDAPRRWVFEAWTDPVHIVKWWGPAGFTNTTHEMDVRPGGVWHFVMHGPDGTDYPNRIVFRTIEPKTRIVYTNSWDLPDATLEFTGVVTFAAEAEGTRLILHMTFADDAAMQTAVERYGVLRGGTETFERIAGYFTR